MLHKRITALEWSVKIFYWRGGGLNRFNGVPTSPLVQINYEPCRENKQEMLHSQTAD